MKKGKIARSVPSRFGHISMHLLVAFVLAALTGIDVVAAQTDSTGNDPLSERLGGTVASFEDKFGEPSNSPSDEIDAVRRYKNKNYVDLSVRAIDGYVFSIAFEPKKSADWTVKKATSVAKRFLPADSECEKARDAGKNTMLVECSSAALQTVMFPADYSRVGRVGSAGSIAVMLTIDKRDDSRVAGIDAIIGTSDLESATEPNSVADVRSGADAAAEQEYLEAINGDIELLSSSVELMQVLFAGASIYDFLDPDWQSQFAVVLGTWMFVHEQAVTRYFPPRFTDLNQKWIAVTSPLNDAAGYYAYGIDNIDATYIELGNYSLSQSTDALEAFTAAYIEATSESGVTI